MTAKESGINIQDLKLCPAMKREIEQINETLLRQWALVEGTTATLKHTPPVKGVHDKIGDAIANIDELERRLIFLRNAYTQHLLIVEEVIEKLSEASHRVVMRSRYMDGMTWDEVGKAAGYEPTYCSKLHTAALKELGIEYPREERARKVALECR